MESDKQSPDAGAASPLNGMLSALLSNPEILGQIRNLSGQTAPASDTPPTSTEPSSPSPESAPVSAVPNADGLSAILSNPELIAKLPQMMATLAPILGSHTEHSAPPPTAGKSPEVCRNDLLLALKPFLSQERRNAVDAILRISKLGTVLKQIK